jgi:hypothetical protein
MPEAAHAVPEETDAEPETYTPPSPQAEVYPEPGEVAFADPGEAEGAYDGDALEEEIPLPEHDEADEHEAIVHDGDPASAAPYLPPVEPGELPRPNQVEEVLTRAALSAGWSPEARPREGARESSGHFLYEGPLPIPGAPPRPEGVTGVGPAPRSSGDVDLEAYGFASVAEPGYASPAGPPELPHEEPATAEDAWDEAPTEEAPDGSEMEFTAEVEAAEAVPEASLADVEGEHAAEAYAEEDVGDALTVDLDEPPAE